MGRVNMATTTDFLAQLQSDGDRVTLEDGRELTLNIVPDDCSSFDDIADMGDVYGRTAWGRRGDYGNERPEGFTGAAEIIHRDGYDALWWEPYDIAGMPGGRDGEAFREYRALVTSILEFGFIGITLTLREDVRDSRGQSHRVEVAHAGLYGIEPFPNAEYVAQVVSDLWEEMRAEMGDDAPDDNAIRAVCEVCGEVVTLDLDYASGWAHAAPGALHGALVTRGE